MAGDGCGGRRVHHSLRSTKMRERWCGTSEEGEARVPTPLSPSPSFMARDDFSLLLFSRHDQGLHNTGSGSISLRKKVTLTSRHGGSTAPHEHGTQTLVPQRPFHDWLACCLQNRCGLLVTSRRQRRATYRPPI
ncbi:hypothetical protein E2C01_044576 [Portunus trituberculatus]|uniref:Uncharacterized protein n=1 Tax=Portunus trituberculatus TaxID=210409 RepID=A0A5B7FYR7_PORTR|nr:hypothetical protein [Portunus trituberculatus]